MTRLTVLIIRRVFPKADDKTVIFVAAFAIMIFGVLYGISREIWEAFYIYGMLPDWRHIYESHGPPAVTAILGFWATMKAAKLIPSLLEEAPLSVEGAEIKINQNLTTGVTTVTAMDLPKSTEEKK